MADTARCAPSNIPEAIQHPWGLALGGSWSALSGSHLTFTASEDIPANGHGGSANRYEAMRSKDEFRKELKQRRKAFAVQVNDFAPAPEALNGLMDALKPFSAVAGYAALTSEPDVFPILDRLHQLDKAIALPAMVEGSAVMVFRAWSPGKPLIMSAHGFRQPADDAPPLTPKAILIPLIGFDAHFNRLGHGAGHFDRALGQRPSALKIGVAWSVQEEPDLPIDAWDVPLDAVLTEREFRVR